MYGVFTGMGNEPCITVPSSRHKMNMSGHFNFEFVLDLYETIPLGFCKGDGKDTCTRPFLIFEEVNMLMF